MVDLYSLFFYGNILYTVKNVFGYFLYGWFLYSHFSYNKKNVYGKFLYSNFLYAHYPSFVKYPTSARSGVLTGAMWAWPPSPWCPTRPTRRGRWRRSASSTGAPRPSATWTPPSSGATSSPSYPAASWVRLTYAFPNGILTVFLAFIYCTVLYYTVQCALYSVQYVYKPKNVI